MVFVGEIVGQRLHMYPLVAHAGITESLVRLVVQSLGQLLAEAQRELLATFRLRCYRSRRVQDVAFAIEIVDRFA